MESQIRLIDMEAFLEECEDMSVAMAEAGEKAPKMFQRVLATGGARLAEASRVLRLYPQELLPRVRSARQAIDDMKPGTANRLLREIEEILE